MSIHIMLISDSTIFPDTSIAMNVIVGRITRSYSDVSGVFVTWANQSDKYWVYEHEADERVNRTHCHFLFKGSKATVKNLKERLDYKNLKLSRSDHSYKEWDELKGKSYLSYCSKGRLDPVLTNDLPTASLAKEQGFDKKEQTSKDNYYDIAMKVRKMSSKAIVLDFEYDEFGNKLPIYKECISSLEEVYSNLMVVLHEHKVRTSEHDLDRWICTIIRDDAKYKDAVRNRVLKKYLPT